MCYANWSIYVLNLDLARLDALYKAALRLCHLRPN